MIPSVLEAGANDGLCECGCGQATALAPQTNRERGWVKGQPVRFVNHHNRRAHGESRPRTPTYRSWMAMRSRCLNPTDKDYPRYGGRGITICAEWDDFDRFLADVGPRPVAHTLDRIDNDGGYEPGNVRWADASTQRRNRPTPARYRKRAARA